MGEFAKGIKVNTFHGDFGDIINLGINVNEIKENPINDKGYLNISLKKAKSGEWYQQINEYKKG